MREQSLLQARLSCRQYQYLIGHILLQEATDFFKIECVAVAPYDELNKWIFAHNYIDDNDALSALGFYEGPYYDIVLLARNIADHSTLVYTSLDEYMQRRDPDKTYKGIHIMS